MAENRTLLSQSEIDALVSFLQQGGATSETTSIGDVLDQSSIDKLVDIIRFNNNHGILLNADTTAAALGAGNVDIPTADGSNLDKSECELEYRITDAGMAEIYCVSKIDGASYRIAPDSLKFRKYISDGSEWGFAVSPRHFNKVANMFRIDYSKETYAAVLARFNKIMYGDENAEAARIYFPVEN